MSAAAGWYADPQNPQLLRYYDGAAWTTHTQPAPQAGQPTAQPPGQPTAPQAAQQGQHGQQAGWQPQDPRQLAAQFTAQPRQGYQKQGQGYQQPGQAPMAAGAAPSGGGTPTAVKIGIAAAFVGILAFTGIALLLGGDEGDSSDGLSDALKGVVSKDFDCAMLGDEAVELSESESPEDEVVSTSGLSPTKDRLSSVEVPSSGEEVALACEGDAEWGDGVEDAITLELRVDSEGETWVYYGRG